jgi:hypothetical protein
MICPLLEQTDPRCADHFSINNLSDAFTHCVGRFQSCPVYQRMVRDRAGHIGAIHASPLLRPGRLAG